MDLVERIWHVKLWRLISFLSPEFMTAQLLRVSNVTSSAAVLEWNHAYKNRVNHVRFKVLHVHVHVHVCVS